MTISSKHRTTDPDTAAPGVLVLICRDLGERQPRIDLGEVTSWLSSNHEGVRVRLEEGLCNLPKAIENPILNTGVDRLVLGVCSGEFSEIEVQAHARRGGIDPLGIQIVNLGMTPDGVGPPAQATARVRTLVASAIARARAYPGSAPENLKVVLASPSGTVSRRALFTLPPVHYVSVPTINRSSCSAGDGCDLCVTACPSGALEMDGGQVLVSRSRCQSCGICVEACPQRAVELPGWSADEIEAHLSSLLDAADLEAVSVAFVCKDGASSLGRGWLPLTVACVSMVPAAAILTALARGATAVGLLPCRTGCPVGTAETVRGRVDYCQQLLSLLGSPTTSDRVQLLEPGAAAPMEPVPAPFPSDVAAKPRLFGGQAASSAIRELAALYKVEDLTLDHPYSPTGLVRIDSHACTGCGACATACPTGALDFAQRQGDVSLTFDPASCVACAKCVAVCPEADSEAIRVDRVTDIVALEQGLTTVFEDSERLCEVCGQAIAPSAMLDRIEVLLGDKERNLVSQLTRFCVECRGSR